MVRTLIKIGLTIAGNAIGLLVAAYCSTTCNLDGAAFILAVVIFTVAELVLEPLIEKMVTQHAERLRIFTVARHDVPRPAWSPTWSPTVSTSKAPARGCCAT